MTNIQITNIVGHSTKEGMDREIATAVLDLQNRRLTVEIQYAGKQHGYYNALVIGRAEPLVP